MALSDDERAEAREIIRKTLRELADDIVASLEEIGWDTPLVALQVLIPTSQTDPNDPDATQCVQHQVEIRLEEGDGEGDEAAEDDDESSDLDLSFPSAHALRDTKHRLN